MVSKSKKIVFILLLLGLAFSVYGEKTYYTLKERVESEENFIRGIFHYSNMEYVAAIEFFRKSLDAIPLNERSRYWLGKAYLMAGYRDLAIAEWESLVRLNSADILLRQKLQQLYTESFLDQKVDLSNALVLLKYLYAAPGVSALECDEQNWLYVANFPDGKVEIRDPNFQSLRTLSSGLSKPMDVSVDQDRVAVSSFGNDQVLIYDRKTGKSLFQIGKFGIQPSEFAGPSGVFFEKGLLYVVDSGNNRVQVFRIGDQVQFLLTFGSKGREPGQFFRPTDVVVFQKNLWVSDAGNRRIQIFDPNGNYLDQIGEETLQAPRKLFVRNDQLYVLDEVLGLLRWDMENRNFEVIKGLNQDVQKPVAVNFDRNGLLYLSDFLTNKISVYSPDKMKLSSLRLSTVLTLNTGYPKIAIKLRVQDLKGQDIQGLSVGNFKLLHEGQKIDKLNLFPLKPEGEKLSLVVLNRASLSMKKYNKDLSDYLRRILKGIRFNDRVAILNYANALVEAQPFTNQNLSLIGQMEKTAYEDLKADVFDNALYQAITKNLNNEFYNGIVIFEDGQSSTDFKKYSPEVLASYARVNGVPIFVIAMDEGPLTPHLKYLAQESGGVYLPFFKSNEIFNLLDVIRRHQPLFYILTYTSPLYQKVNQFFWLNLFLELDYKGLYGAERSGFFIP